VPARIIEPTSKLDSLRVLEEAGMSPPWYRTITRRLPVFAQASWRQRLAAACATHAGLGPASPVLTSLAHAGRPIESSYDAADNLRSGRLR
jgi:hypothetical protein